MKSEAGQLALPDEPDSAAQAGAVLPQRGVGTDHQTMLRVLFVQQKEKRSLCLHSQYQLLTRWQLGTTGGSSSCFGGRASLTAGSRLGAAAGALASTKPGQSSMCDQRRSMRFSNGD